ncbi:MAG: trypsin-like peptidase domain-containing protein [Clostridia bacterium]|nr:trypsin-like peptidase domain-containing protein [Clostridia bacterium]
MKNLRKYGLFAVVLIILSTLLLTGCNVDDSLKVIGATVNEKGELVINYADGKTENLGEVKPEEENSKPNTDNNVGGSSGAPIISTEADVSLATSKGLRSSVSIFCTFGTESSPYYSAGSGVIFKLDKRNGKAFIVTNYHVVYDKNEGISKEISVYLYGNEYADSEIKATYVGGSLNYDIAVLYVADSEIIKNSCVVAADIADSDRISVGQTAIAIGNAEGYGLSASSGVISIDSEYIDMIAPDEITQVSFRVMRIDTAVNHGNSGGGLFNAQGKLIGIVNAKIIDENVENIGYAIPSTLAVAVANNIIDNCFEKECSTLQRCLLGITITPTSSSAIYDESTGLVSIVESIGVAEVSEGSIAYGIVEADDILISATLNGITKEITRQFHVIDLMINARPGDTMYLTVMRGDETVTLSIEITEDCVTSY